MNIDELHAALKLAAEHHNFEKWRFWTPVPKHREFFAAGVDHFERLLMAGNGNGKSEAAAYEVSRHLTGQYPADWAGYRFTKPVRVWVGGTAGIAVRDAAQTKLCGPPGDSEMLGSGFIPREAFIGAPSAGRSAPNSIDSFSVRHISGGVSRTVFKTYEQDRRHWQGADIDLMWFDEEPPSDIYAEGLARLRGRGRSLMTFTPLEGMSDVVLKFLENKDPKQRVYIQMGLRDATWYSDEERHNMISGYPAMQRQARMNGDPFLGGGKVFTTNDDELREVSRVLTKVPLEWLKLWAIDFGSGDNDSGEDKQYRAHPFAAVLYAYDRESDTVHILHCYKSNEILPLIHAAHMKQIAPNLPVVWPHDGHERERSSGEPLAAHYKKQGLRMYGTHATHPTGGYSTYAGIQDMDNYMRGGRWKVSGDCAEWFAEYGQYHYKNGLLVKIRDDLMSASRIGHMMRRAGRAGPIGGRIFKQERATMCDGIDFPLFA